MPNDPLSRVPACSSRQAIAALKRLGAYPGKMKGGSHVSFHRELEDGKVVTAVMVVGRREMRKGTLQAILPSLEIPLEDFNKKLR